MTNPKPQEIKGFVAVVKNLQFSFSITLFWTMVEVCFVPFKWAKPDFRTQSVGIMPEFAPHLFVGPFHIWTFRGTINFASVGVNISQNFFHGEPLIPRPATLTLDTEKNDG